MTETEKTTTESTETRAPVATDDATPEQPIDEGAGQPFPAITIDGKPLDLKPRAFVSMDDANKALASAGAFLRALGFSEYVLSVSATFTATEDQPPAMVLNVSSGRLDTAIFLALHASRHVAKQYDQVMRAAYERDKAARAAAAAPEAATTP